MDWKNVLEGAGGIHLFQPYEEIEDSINRLIRLVGYRAETDRVDREEALRRIRRERRIGQISIMTVILSLMGACLWFAHQNEDGWATISIFAAGIAWAGSQFIPLNDVPSSDESDYAHL